jgi:hypothetical protein
MGEYKKQITVIVSLLLLITILTLTACSPVKRHARLVKRYPFVHQTDTVILTDTIRLTIPEIRTDTIMQLDSFLIQLQDTIVIEKDNLSVKIMQVHDSIYIDAKCDTIYVDKIITQKVPVKYYEVENKWCLKNKFFYALYLFLILLLLIIILKVIKFLKS